MTGETPVMLADGRRVPIRELVGQTPEVWAMSEDQKIVRARSDLVWSKGVRQVFRVALASGRVLRATSNHRVFTGDGWRPVGQLGPGSRVAVGRQFPKVGNPIVWSDAQICLLGHLVGDGSYLKHQPLRYTTASEANSKLVTECAIELGSTVTRHAGRGKWHQLVIANNGNRWHAAGVGAWLKGLGIYDQRSHQKHLPAAVFQLGDLQIGLLLKHLWATDGCIHVRPAHQRGGSGVNFTTCSEKLAQDVAALLLRLGIVARTSLVRQRIGRPVYSVSVSGSEQQALFLEKVGAFGPREIPAKLLAAKISVTRSSPNVDALPREVFAAVRAVMTETGITQRKMASMRGISYGVTAHSKFAPSRSSLSSYADILQSDQLQTWANSHLFWDRVVAVGLEGEEEVFDMTVPGRQVGWRMGLSANPAVWNRILT